MIICKLLHVENHDSPLCSRTCCSMHNWRMEGKINWTKDSRSYYKLERNQSLRGLGKGTWRGADLRQGGERQVGQKDKVRTHWVWTTEKHGQVTGFHEVQQPYNFFFLNLRGAMLKVFVSWIRASVKLWFVLWSNKKLKNGITSLASYLSPK